MDTLPDRTARASRPAADSDPGAAERIARLRLAAVVGLSPRLLHRLVRAVGGARRVLDASPAVLARVRGVGRVRSELVRGAPGEEETIERLDALTRAGVRTLIPSDEEWPAGLADLDDPPLLLFARGRLTDADRRAVAVVGSRRATPYGLRTASRIAGELGALGLTVVSGLARGVDTAAHRGALESGGRTLAVLGSGFHRFYPPENASLAVEIADGRGAVLTEFAPEVAPRPYHFPRRNRILAALAAAVLVVEAGERSGSLITADHALDIGRDVLAVPGRVDAPGSCGTHRLLREGAALCSGVADVLSALGLERCDVEATRAERRAANPRNEAERRVLEAVRGRELDADAIIDATLLPLPVILATLSSLELEGVLRALPDGRYGLA